MNQANNITIEVHTHYLKEHSEAPEKYTFAYKITISNKGQQGAKLINRYWLITDGNGKKTEVEGQGVVGEQPHIPVGESFQYTSGAMLDTPVGTMQGFYEMQNDSGESFKAPIEVFRLAVPNSLN